MFDLAAGANRLPRRATRRLVAAAVGLAALLPAACGDSDGGSSSGNGNDRPLTISAIPDQDPSKLGRLYGDVAAYLTRELGVKVVYKPVTDYPASVSGFRLGDLDLVWFGGFTSVQAEKQVAGAKSVAQREIDGNFHSVFIANTKSGIAPMPDVAGLSALKGRRFTFGSETSTSGRLMPQYYLDQAGVKTTDFRGPPGFSGSHDATIREVASGSYEAGALNEQVWKSSVADGTVKRDKVRAVLTTPGYPDYRWLGQPDLDERFGAGFTDRVTRAFVALDPADPKEKAILELFGAERFVKPDPGAYSLTKEAVDKLGLGG